MPQLTNTIKIFLFGLRASMRGGGGGLLVLVIFFFLGFFLFFFFRAPLVPRKPETAC